MRACPLCQGHWAIIFHEHLCAQFCPRVRQQSLTPPRWAPATTSCTHRAEDLHRTRAIFLIYHYGHTSYLSSWLEVDHDQSLHQCNSGITNHSWHRSRGSACLPAARPRRYSGAPDGGICHDATATPSSHVGCNRTALACKHRWPGRGDCDRAGLRDMPADARVTPGVPSGLLPQPQALCRRALLGCGPRRCQPKSGRPHDRVRPGRQEPAIIVDEPVLYCPGCPRPCLRGAPRGPRHASRERREDKRHCNTRARRYLPAPAPVQAVLCCRLLPQP